MIDRLAMLRTFVVIARSPTMTHAASVLGLSKASVTRHLAALEAELGLLLLIRNNRYIKLSEPGQALLRKAEAVLEEFDTVQDRVRAQSVSAYVPPARTPADEPLS